MGYTFLVISSQDFVVPADIMAEMSHPPYKKRG
jgi:hypothetical protein